MNAAAGAPEDETGTVPRWEHFAHDADIGIRGIGRTPAQAFEQAAIAMTAVICEPSRIAPRHSVEIASEADEPDLLFVDFLNELVLEMATRGMLFGRFEVTIEGKRLRAVARGEDVDPARHEPAAEVKGATFTELRVTRDDGGIWRAQCVLDV